MSFCERCCGRGNAADNAPIDTVVEMSVKDRGRQLNAGNKSVPATGQGVHDALRNAPKPDISVGRQSVPAQAPARQSTAPQRQTVATGAQARACVAPPAAPASVRASVSPDAGAGAAQASVAAPRPPTAGGQPASTGAAGQASMAGGPSLEEEVTSWIEVVTGETKGRRTFGDWLKDGKVLIRLANQLQPDICPRCNEQAMPFKQMENISAFIAACRTLGVLEKDLFSTVDLFELKNLKPVFNCIASLGSVCRTSAPCFRGPYIGVAQNAKITDKARKKTIATQDGGFRQDVAGELRDGRQQGRHM